MVWVGLEGEVAFAPDTTGRSEELQGDVSFG